MVLTTVTIRVVVLVFDAIVVPRAWIVNVYIGSVSRFKGPATVTVPVLLTANAEFVLPLKIEYTTGVDGQSGSAAVTVATTSPLVASSSTLTEIGP